MHRKSRWITVTMAFVAASSLLALNPANAAPANTIGLGGILPNLNSVQIRTANVYDYTFASPPTDWRVQSGIWNMTNRWSCSPGWSWFGGRSEAVAAVWNKRTFSGDLSVQCYFAFKMNLADTPRWNYHPSNVAMTILGNGKDLGTGYTLIIGDDNNTRTILMRNGKIVAQTTNPEALLPSVADGNPSMQQLHRHWWYLRINKVGQQVQCYFENKLILTYHDPSPIDSGQTAIWTYNNGIMLSRVQIYFENEKVPSRPARSDVTNLLAFANQ